MALLEKIEDTRLYRWLKYSLNESLVAFFRAHVFQGCSGLLVGEFACGSGYGAHCLAQEPAVGLSVALDLSVELHAQCSFADYRANFIVGDLLSAPLRKDEFDFVWSSSSVEHFANPQAAVQAMAEVTKPGGCVFVGVPYLYGPLAVYHVTPSPGVREWLGRPFSLAELEGLFHACGLTPCGRLIYFFRFFAGVLGRKQKQ